MALVLLATGLFVYLRVSAQLDRTIEAGLRSRADDIGAFVRRSGPFLSENDEGRLTESDESFAQLIGKDGDVLDATSDDLRRPLLDPERQEWAREDTIIADIGVVPHLDHDPIRVIATPVETQGRTVVLVVGTSIDDRAEALAGLARQLAISGSVDLLLAALASYGLATAALRPVESMRRQAAEISAAEPGRRLELPVSRDEVSRLGATLNQMLERLEAALARERAFVSDASHELRTPLAILKAELELALREGRTMAELQAALRSAAEETDRLAQLAEDLLVIARADQGRLPVRSAPHEVGEILGSVTERFAGRARAAGRTLELDPAPGAVVVDPMRLQQALSNMVDNALRHGAGPVRLSAVERDGHVELHVSDEGPGFPPDFLGAAFDRFSRADEARGRGGAGLGLAVVESIAAAHGGKAGALNRPEGGADVWISVPKAAAQG